MVKVSVHLQLWFDIVIHYGSCGVKSDIWTIETQLETYFFGGLFCGEVTISVKNVQNDFTIILENLLF